MGRFGPLMLRTGGFGNDRSRPGRPTDLLHGLPASGDLERRRAKRWRVRVRLAAEGVEHLASGRRRALPALCGRRGLAVAPAPLAGRQVGPPNRPRKAARAAAHTVLLRQREPVRHGAYRPDPVLTKRGAAIEIVGVGGRHHALDASGRLPVRQVEEEERESRAIGRREDDSARRAAERGETPRPRYSQGAAPGPRAPSAAPPEVSPRGAAPRRRSCHQAGTRRGRDAGATRYGRDLFYLALATDPLSTRTITRATLS